MLVVIAGYETTTNLLDQAICQVLIRPRVAGLLRAGTIRWSELIEETVRYRPPVAILPSRYAVVDIEVAGARICAGDPLVAAITRPIVCWSGPVAAQTNSIRDGRWWWRTRWSSGSVWCSRPAQIRRRLAQ